MSYLAHAATSFQSAKSLGLQQKHDDFGPNLAKLWHRQAQQAPHDNHPSRGLSPVNPRPPSGPTMATEVEQQAQLQPRGSATELISRGHLRQTRSAWLKAVGCADLAPGRSRGQTRLSSQPRTSPGVKPNLTPGPSRG